MAAIIDTDPLFKGCTRPSMIWGVPLVPLAAASVPLLVIGMWGMSISPRLGLSALFCLFPIFLIMRMVTKKDDQRLMQYLLRFQMRARQRNRNFWKASSYSPIRYKKEWRCD